MEISNKILVLLLAWILLYFYYIDYFGKPEFRENLKANISKIFNQNISHSYLYIMENFTHIGTAFFSYISIGMINFIPVINFNFKIYL